MNIIEFQDVHRAYRPGVEVLRGISFSVDPAEVVGLLGKNGAGKTTLMRIAMGTLEPGRGSVRLFGLDPRREPVTVKRRVGYVSEDQVLPAFFKVSQVLELHRKLYPGWDQEFAEDLCRRFDLAPGRKVGKLSKGQARQVALVCAVAHRPELLLLDEPAGGLDPAARREFLETSIRLLNETGTTILFSSHHMADVERVAGRVVMIDEGQVLLDRSLDDLREAFCLALLPERSEEAVRRLRSLDGCIRVRERAGGLHAVLSFSPADAPAMLEREIGVAGIRCVPIALEDMFVELVGGAA